MGANAQTSVPKFTASQVLTAAQQNLINTGVPVFATTTTRDAAFGGSNKALAQGQMCFIEATNQTQYYNGTSWVAVDSSGLVVVKAETAFTAASSITADSVFTSTYTNYVVKFRYTTSTTNSVAFKLRASGTSASTNYNYQSTNGNGASTFASSATAQTSASMAILTNGSFFSSATLDLFGPQLAEATTYTSLNMNSQGAYTAPLNYYIAGNHSTATAYDGIEILVSTGTMTGSYTIYGLAKS